MTTTVQGGGAAGEPRYRWAALLPFGLASGSAQAALPDWAGGLLDALLWLLPGLLLALAWRPLRREPGDWSAALPDCPRQLALLGSGAIRATDVLLLDLLRRGLVTVAADGRRVVRIVPGPGREHLDALQHRALELLATPLRPALLASRLDGEWLALQQLLRARGLLCSAAAEASRARIAWLALALLAWQLLAPGLSLLCTALAVFGASQAPLGPTTAALAALQQLRARQARLRQAPCADEAALAVALFGLAALDPPPCPEYWRLRRGQYDEPYGGNAGCRDRADRREHGAGSEPELDACGGD